MMPKFGRNVDYCPGIIDRIPFILLIIILLLIDHVDVKYVLDRVGYFYYI